MKQLEINTNTLLFQSKVTAKRSWTAFKSRSLEDKFKWLSKRNPYACEMFDMKKMQEFYYPEIDGIIIHLNDQFIKYETEDEAYNVAVKIKEVLQNEIK